MKDRAIGIFDSGVGGLSVLQEIQKLLPFENFIYVADSGFAPYGDKDERYVRARAQVVMDYLLAQNVKAIVVACNTATVVAIDVLRQHSPVPIVALEPAIKPAVRLTRSGVVVVLATQQTVNSPAVAKLCAAYVQDVKVLLQACTGWVEFVERGELGGDAIKQLLTQSLAPLLAQGADTFVLGCTHFVFLKPMLAQVIPAHAQMLDSGQAVARELQRRLQVAEMLNTGAHQNSVRFVTSFKTPTDAAIIISKLLAQSVTVELLGERQSNSA